MRQLYLVFVFLFCFCQIIYAEMTINKIEMQDDKFTIVLNNALQISNITLSKKWRIRYCFSCLCIKR